MLESLAAAIKEGKRYHIVSCDGKEYIVSFYYPVPAKIFADKFKGTLQVVYLTNMLWNPAEFKFIGEIA